MPEPTLGDDRGGRPSHFPLPAGRVAPRFGRLDPLPSCLTRIAARISKARATAFGSMPRKLATSRMLGGPWPRGRRILDAMLELLREVFTDRDRSGPRMIHL